MGELKRFEFFVLRYVPDAVKEEFINLGLVLSECGASGKGYSDVRFTTDWWRVQCLDSQVDTELLQTLEADIRYQLQNMDGRDSLLRRLEDSFSNLVQLSPTRGVLTEDPAQEIKVLTKLYLEQAHNVPKAKLSGRRIVWLSMKSAFEDAGIWDLMLRDISVASFTMSGDPLKLDCGYPIGNAINFFQAVSLRSSVDQAVALAARFPAIGAGIRDAKGAVASLTAVVEDGLNRAEAEVGFALGMMEKNGVRHATVSELPMIAERVRLELKA